MGLVEITMSLNLNLFLCYLLLGFILKTSFDAYIFLGCEVFSPQNTL